MSGMQPVLVLLWWAGVAALTVWAIRRKSRKKQDERESYTELRSVSESHGWVFEEVVPGLCDTYKGTGPFLRWSKNVAGYHAVSGTHRGYAFRAFESRFSGDALEAAEHANVLSVWVLELGVDVPDLRVYRDGWLDTILRGQAMTVGIPRLDKDFHLVSRDEERARELLRGGLATFLLSDGRATELPLHLSGGRLLTWREGTALSAETFVQSLEYLVDVVRHLGSAEPDRSARTP